MVTPSSSSYSYSETPTMASHHLQDFGQNTEMYNFDMLGFQNKNHHHLQHQQNEQPGSSLMWKNNIYQGSDVGPPSSSKPINSTSEYQFYNHGMMVGDDGLFGQPGGGLSYNNVYGGQQFEIRNSRYLFPAQEILNEFVSLGIEQNNLTSKLKLGHHSTDELLDDNSKKQSSLFSVDLLELQRRKAKLLQMLEEVDRRYKHYCEQMKSVLAPFEAVAGNNAAKVYSISASKAMSRHFRRLRDAILGQIKITRKAMGEKDSGLPGTTKGETPRLRILDQTLRQQRAFQQISIMDSQPWRPQRGLPERSVSVLRAWLFEHFLHPYPSDVDKHILSHQTGLSRSQVSNWFINARVRLWKPMVEEMYLEELKEQDSNNNLPDSMDGQTGADLHLDDEDGNNNNNQLLIEDHKPTPDQLVRINAECFSSIVNTNVEKNKNDGKNNGKNILQEQEQPHHHQLHKNFNSGAMEFDFSAYNQYQNSRNEIHFGDNENAHHNHQQNYGGGSGSGHGNGISLTLGLQQHGESGVSLAFPSASHHHQSSLFYSRDQIEDCQQVPQYPLLDNHESQTLPYRNLMGAQLLHDLAG